jgi:hypothetical protein
MTRSIKNILPVLVVFLIINLACNFPTSESTSPAREATPIPPVQLEGEGESSFDLDPSSGRVTIILTEHDLTGYLITEMEAQDNAPLRDPQVLLRDGQIVVLGQVQTGPFLSDIRLAIGVDIDTGGMPEFQVLSADFGSMPAPTQVRDQLSGIANNIFRQYIRPQMQGYRAESIVIDTGRLIITGVPQ